MSEKKIVFSKEMLEGEIGRLSVEVAKFMRGDLRNEPWSLKELQRAKKVLGD